MKALATCTKCNKALLTPHELYTHTCDAAHCEEPVMVGTPGWTYRLGDHVRKRRGGQWHGTVVGFYSTDLTAEGYAVESAFERGSVQIYPVAALEPWEGPASYPAPPEPVSD